MPSFTKRIFIVILLVLSVKSYAGTVKGNVTDKQSGEPAVGAIVSLHGTAYGNTTGLDGSYILRGVAEGEYDFEITYTSFSSYTEHIFIKDTQTIVLNEQLSPLSSTLKEVEVKAKYKNGSEEQARN